MVPASPDSTGLPRLYRPHQIVPSDSWPTWLSRNIPHFREGDIFAALLLKVSSISHSSAPVQNSKQMFSCQLHIIQYGLQQQQQSHYKHGPEHYLLVIRCNMSCLTKSPRWRTEGSDVKDISAENLEMLHVPLVKSVVFTRYIYLCWQSINVIPSSCCVCSILETSLPTIQKCYMKFLLSPYYFSKCLCQVSKNVIHSSC